MGTKRGWRAKAMMLIFAFALVFGMVPMLVAPQSTSAGTLVADFDANHFVVKVGQTIQFTDLSQEVPEGTLPSNWEWDFESDTTVDSNVQNPTHAYTAEGIYDVTLTAWWGTIDASPSDTVTKQVVVSEAALIPQVDANVLSAEALFVVPDVYYGKVVNWFYLTSLGLNTYQVVSGGNTLLQPPPPPPAWNLVPPAHVKPIPYQWDSVLLRADEPGALGIVAQIDTDGNAHTIELTVIGEKKWGKIDITEIWHWPGYTNRDDGMTPDELTLMSWRNMETGEMEIGSGSTQIYWDENDKKFKGDETFVERVVGTFPTDPVGGVIHTGANGAEVHWWLVKATANVDSVNYCAGDTELIAAINALPRAKHVVFANGTAADLDPPGPPGGADPMTHVTTTSGWIDTNGNGAIEPDGFGLTINTLVPSGEEAVKVIVLATYPNLSGELGQWPVCPEIVSWNFWTQELEKVPQVRWAGEEIILEKEFGQSYAGNYVQFVLEKGPAGALVGGLSADAVWTVVARDGVARCDLDSEKQGEVDVKAVLWDLKYPGVDQWLWAGECGLVEPPPDDDLEHTGIINKHGFVVFFLKLEEITLGNVLGERVDNPLTSDVGPLVDWWPLPGFGVYPPLLFGEIEWLSYEGHNTGIWSPENPWDTTTDMLTETLNVSEDTLVRARVKGWFMGDNLSWRPEKCVDLDPTWDTWNATTGQPGPDGDATNDCDVVLPKGRWVLPDDWPALAGPRWWEFRPHWDIMDNPDDLIMSDFDRDADKAEEVGPYYDYTGFPIVPRALVADAPVIGPFSSLDNYTPAVNPVLGRKTIVQNGVLDWWDCPMPPAKIVFEVLDLDPDEWTDDAGFFKEVNKGHIYYNWIDDDNNPNTPDVIVYTNPFYSEMIPANRCIPPFVNNGGYDWDSFDPSYGPYPFWDIFNQPPGDTYADEQHPTKVEVYSDNHGEAMVYLNGDWNLWLLDWVGAGGYDIPPDTVVASSDVVAIADYPYFRKHQPMVSNVVTKTWTWGKEILGASPVTFPGGGVGPDNRMIFQVGALSLPTDTPPLNSMEKMVFVWVCDRDGMPAVGERIEWSVTPTFGYTFIPNTTNYPVSTYVNPNTMLTEHLWVGVENGFLVDTGGYTVGDPPHQFGVSFTRLPTWQELLLFDKFWGDTATPLIIENWHHAVAAIYLTASGEEPVDLVVDLYEPEGKITRHVNFDWAVADAWDDAVTLGDANMDTGVDMADVTMVERMIMGLSGNRVNADANWDGNVDMADVTKIEMTILGY